jgi:hypothetical protein
MIAARLLAGAQFLLQEAGFAAQVASCGEDSPNRAQAVRYNSTRFAEEG